MDFAGEYRDLLEARGGVLSADSFETMVEEAWKLRWVDVGVQAVLAPVVYITLGLLFWQVLRRSGAPRLSFSSAMAVLVHGFLPWLVAYLLSVPVVLTRDSVRPSGLRSELLPSHLGVLAPESIPPAARAVLESVDIFSLWTMALLVIGYSVVAHLRTTRVALVVVGAWAAYVAGRALLASIGAL
jgi:hypothetical protein